MRQLKLQGWIIAIRIHLYAFLKLRSYVVC